MWDDRSERHGAGYGREGRIEGVRGDRDDEADPHVPRVELLDLFEIAEPREEREERRHLPGLPVDPRGRAVGQRARNISFPPTAGEVSDRVDLRDVAQRAELRKVRPMGREQRRTERSPAQLLAWREEHVTERRAPLVHRAARADLAREGIPVRMQAGRRNTDEG